MTDETKQIVEPRRYNIEGVTTHQYQKKHPYLDNYITLSGKIKNKRDFNVFNSFFQNQWHEIG